MKIFMLAQFYPPIMGGIERHVESLSQSLVKNGHQVSVVTLWHNGLPEFEVREGVKIYRVHGTVQRMTGLFTTDRQHAPPFPDPGLVNILKRLIALEKPDIVHAHNWLIHSFLPLKAWGKAKLVMTLHDSEMTCVQMRMMYKDTELCSGPELLKCTVCAVHHYGIVKGSVTLAANTFMSCIERSSVDLFLPVSTAIAKSNKLIGSKSKYEVIPNFVPDNIAQVGNAIDPRMSVLPGGDFILQVGDLSRDKGVYILLEAYGSLQSPPPLVFIGRSLPESPTKLPKGVTVINDLPHSVVMQAWQRCMFGVTPSLCLDASPTVTLEAMSVGKPIIGSRIGGIVDQIADGETGLLFQPGNVQELSQAMALLIANPALRARFGEAAKRKVVEFQSSSIVSRIEKLYLGLLK